MSDTLEEDDLFQDAVLLWPDYLVIALYFVFVIVIGIWASRGGRRVAEEQRDRVAGYFLASRNMHFIPVGGALFASNIGSEHFIGLAGSGAAGGIAIANYEINAIFILMLLGWFFVPVYLASGIYTMPEYLKTRFGGQRIQLLLSLLSLLAYVFTKISADLYAGALFIKLSVGLNGTEGLYISIFILLALAAFFTLFGGLTAVMWTELMQTILMVAGALTLTGISYYQVGGLGEIFDAYSRSLPEANYSSFQYDSETDSYTNVSCSAVRSDFAHMFRSPIDGDLPWTGTFTGMFLNSIWYWCADQVIVQRTLASKNVSHAKGGCVVAAFLKILPLFVIVIPGMIARILWPNLVGCSDEKRCETICGSKEGCTNISYVLLVLKLMPQGLRGVMLAVMLAALMSSLSSIFNSASTIFTMDIWKWLRKNATDIELIVVGRCAVVVLVGISVLWIPVILKFKTAELFVYVQSVSSFIQPPITAVFLTALLWHRVTEPAAFWSLIIGFAIGIIRMSLDFSYSAPACGTNLTALPDDRPDFIVKAVAGFHYLHYGCVVFLLTVVSIVVISLVTEPFRLSQLWRLTFRTRFSTELREPIDIEDKDERAATAETTNADGQSPSQGAKPLLRRILYRLCLVSRDEEQHATVAGAHVSAQEMANIAVAMLHEEKRAKWLCNAGAVAVMCCGTFIWAYFA